LQSGEVNTEGRFKRSQGSLLPINPNAAWRETRGRIDARIFFQSGRAIHLSFFHCRQTFNEMTGWFIYALGAALLYALHQVFTKLAADKISDGLGGFVVEASAALTIVAYLLYLRLSGRWNQTATATGIYFSTATGVCVGAGTILFFLLFQKGGPLSAVPVILAGAAALMALVGIFAFREPASLSRIIGITLAIAGLFLLRR
jgi:transporter family protein